MRKCPQSCPSISRSTIEMAQCTAFAKASFLLNRARAPTWALALEALLLSPRELVSPSVSFGLGDCQGCRRGLQSTPIGETHMATIHLTSGRVRRPPKARGTPVSLKLLDH